MILIMTEKNRLKAPTKVSILFHKTRQKNQRKLIYLIGIEEKSILKIQNHLKKLEERGKFCRSNSYVALQIHPCCPTHFAMASIGISDKINEIIKMFGTTEIRTPT